MIILTITGVLVLFLGLGKGKNFILPVAGLGVLTAMWSYFHYNPIGDQWMKGMMSMEAIPAAFVGLLLSCTLLIIPFLNRYKLRGPGELGDFAGIILFAVIGGMMMVSHEDLMILFLGIEMLSIAMYILAGSDRRIIQSNEASLKYLIMGSFASAIFLFGVGLYYVATGTFKLVDFKIISPEIFAISIMVIFAGLAFKVSLAPFHFWAPDVYQGSPTLVTAIMATVVKIAGFGALFQFLRHQVMHTGEWYYWLILLVAISSMVIGNVMAFGQRSVKRLLAYSGVVQAGFILVGFLHLKDENSWMIVFYLVAYVLASLVSFVAIYFVESKKGSDDISEFKGLFFQNPFLAIVFTIALLSLGGGPLTAGFMAKLFVLYHAAGLGSPLFVVLALILAVISMYYYFKVINQFFTKEEEATSEWKLDWTYQSVLLLISALTICLGLFPYLLTQWIGA
ncbi:MAG: NADH-quinone oxidoreductase subunit N [Saprospiraceae bacterium]|nr:NADH-quinone oxidoreductase subunit N [Saprospiraceae bacterium]MBK7810849.1 NADH-quinone oxidoreductase subunit N [Saprospiraceae bacterium]MBK9630450.1 NADH-quinone oxidoreductase subunit N [Saprospiraceae bacterium]